MKVAAIDCGTNSIRLLIAEVADHQLTDIIRTMIIVRLGEGVDQTGEFSQDALKRTFDAAERFAELIQVHQPERIRFVATSASRDVSNRQQFFEGIKDRLGVEPEVISGDEEAHLSFIGATAELRAQDPNLRSPYLVVDIGGGSTEFVLGTDSPSFAISTNVGCVRMTERHLVNDPPTPAQIQSATDDIDAAISQAGAVIPFDRVQSFIGVAGSVTTVAALSLGLSEYDPEQIHGSRITATEVHRITTELLAMTRSERAELGPMHEGRIDVIGGGALVLDRIMTQLSLGEVVVSERDILDGIAFALAR